MICSPISSLNNPAVMLREGGASSNHRRRILDRPPSRTMTGLWTMTPSLLPVTTGALPAVLGNVEDDAVGVLELALEIAVTFVAKIEEEFAAGCLDALLGLDEIVDLEAEMVRADKTLRILQVRGGGAGAGREIEQGEIDRAVAHINGRADIQILARDGLEIEHGLGELCGLVEMVHADGEMA